MRIVDEDLNIRQIHDIKKGMIPVKDSGCSRRHSDCFAYVLSGKALYRFGDETVEAEKGNILFLSKDSSYENTITEWDYCCYFINFSFETDHPLKNEVFKQEKLKKLENIFIKLHTLWTAGNFADKIYCKSLIYNIYSDIVKENALQYIPSSKKTRIDLALEKIKTDYTKPDISIEALCAECSMSEVHFRRLFYQIYHTSPMKYIISLRLNKAKELLTNSPMKIQDISEACGFNNPYYFSKVFKSAVGLTPSQYRGGTVGHDETLPK